MLYPGKDNNMDEWKRPKVDLTKVYAAREAKKSKLEVWLDYHNHEMELVRTLVPIAVLILQAFILIKIM
jgi:transposase